MLIDHTNYSTTLKQSTNPRGSAPNGNIYFDVANNRIQLIGADELAQVDLGSGLVTNPLNATDGITMRALYNFENARRRLDETLRKYKRGTDGDYRFAGAYSFVNGVKLDGTDRTKIRGSGFIEYAATGDGQTAVDRIYHGVTSLVDIQASSVPYYALVSATDESTLQAATWTNFVRTGDINEVVQVYGTTANGDSGAGTFDYKTRTLVVRVRSWGYNPGETTSVASGISEFSGNSAGYGVGESLNPANSYTLANVYGGSKIAPWTGMSLEKLASPQTETGFNEANGSFTWVLHNTGGGTVAQCAAFLDALSLQDSDIDSAAGTTYNGKKGRVWYTRNAAGKVVTSSVGGAGLFIEGLSVAEKQNIIMTANDGTAKTYPYFPSVEITVGAAAAADPNAWYQVFYEGDGAGPYGEFDTSTAETVKDDTGADVKGNVQAKVSGGKISFAYPYDAQVAGGRTNFNMVAVVEGDGVAAQAITYFPMTRIAIVAVTCAPPAETNA